MDVLITKRARHQIEGLLLGKTECSGLILGHQRGPRYVIEAIFPYPGVLSFSRNKHLRLIRHFGPDLIGYFAGGTRPPERILSPLAAGMLFSSLNKDKSGIRFYQIEYNGQFTFQKLEIFKEESG
ncbi:MAG: hypothetical protein ACOC5U_02025 [Candidatus Aminicenantaceae bacterium]